MALGGGTGDQLRSEVGARDALRETIAQPTGEPQERRAVAENEVGIEEDAAQLHIVSGLSEEIDVGGHHIVGLARRDHGIDAIKGALDREGIEGDAQHRDRAWGSGNAGGRSGGRAKEGGRMKFGEGGRRGRVHAPIEPGPRKLRYGGRPFRFGRTDFNPPSNWGLDLLTGVERLN